MNRKSASKPVWKTPRIKDVPIFFEVSLYSAAR